MNNLYKQLKISPRASPKKIKAALARCADDTLRGQATRLLLDPENRRAYDQTHQLLTNLGILKARLKIGFASNYERAWAEAYYHREPWARSRKAHFLNKLRYREQNRHRLKKWGYGLFSLALVAAYGQHVLAPFTTSRGAATVAVAPASPPPRAVPAPAPLARWGPPQQAMRYHTPAEPNVPLVIKTPPDKNYFIKFEAPDGQLVGDIYIEGGQAVEVKLPENFYIIKYAQGSRWEGYGEWFGLTPGVKYKKIDNIVHFAATTPIKKYIINIDTNAGGKQFPGHRYNTGFVLRRPATAPRLRNRKFLAFIEFSPENRQYKDLKNRATF